MNNNLECDIAITGSYLGWVVKNKDFFLPAGDINHLNMHQLSFREFCRIFNYDKTLDKIDIYGNGNNDEYIKLFELYNIYRKIGGYPAVVKEYIRSKNIDRCGYVIRDLLDTFENESKSYFNDSKSVEIFKSVYSEATKEMVSESKGTGSRIIEHITKFTKSSLKTYITRDEISEAISWIIISGIIGTCDLYLDGDVNNIYNSRRMYYIDCGIANYIANSLKIPDKIIEGFITENFVFSELNRLHGKRYTESFVIGDHVGFSTYGNYALDFIEVGKDKTIYGIEVKTGSGDPKSLKVYVNKHLIDRGILAKKSKGGHSDKYDTIPIFAVGARFPYK